MTFRDWLKDNWLKLLTAILLIGCLIMFALIVKELRQKEYPAEMPSIINLNAYNLTAVDGRPQVEYVVGFATPDNIVIEASFKITNQFDK